MSDRERAALRVADAALVALVAATAARYFVPRFFPWPAYWAAAPVAIVAGTAARVYLVVTVRRAAGSVTVPSDPT